MKASIDHLLYLISELGTEKALEGIDVESIEDEKIKIICRTIQFSCSELKNVIIDRIHERDTVEKGVPESA